MWTLITAVFDKALDYFVDSDEVKLAKEEGRIKKIQAKADWEVEQAKSSDNSNKDEAIVYVFLAIFVAGFIPFLQPYVKEGFKIVGEYPEWFQYCFITVILASFGIRVGKGVFKRK